MPTAPNADSPDLEDRRLVQVFLERGREADFRELYQRHAPALNVLLVRMLRGNTHDAAEALQETWLRAVQRLREFRWESAFRTWINGIAVNCARERRRASAHDVQAEPVDAPSRALDHPIDPLDLEAAIAELPDGFREVLVLHDVEGHTHEEIARMLGIVAGTSKSQLSRARRSLRRRLEEVEDIREQRIAR
jgi:RNA polymerase sigma-70 factor (ECF subfamily)